MKYKQGRPVKSKGERASVQVPCLNASCTQELSRLVDNAAEMDRVSRAQFVRHAVAEYLTAHATR